MTQKYLATWPESPKRVRKKILTHAKDTPRSHTKLLSSPSRDLASLGIMQDSAVHPETCHRLKAGCMLMLAT